MGVPYAVALGLLVAILDLIPLAGATVAGIIVVGVAFLHAIPAGIVVLIFVIVYQQLENHFLQPVIYGRTVQLSPLAVLVSVLVGAELAGDARCAGGDPGRRVDPGARSGTSWPTRLRGLEPARRAAAVAAHPFGQAHTTCNDRTRGLENAPYGRVDDRRACRWSLHASGVPGPLRRSARRCSARSPRPRRPSSTSRHARRALERSSPACSPQLNTIRAAARPAAVQLNAA